MMTFEEFHNSTREDIPPHGISPPLLALWHDARLEWHLAHDIAQNESSPDAAWVHAYLHRKEGDVTNATYWYQRAGRPVSKASLSAEWAEIVRALIG